MAFEITSVQQFWQLDLNKNGRISKNESKEAVATYDIDGDKSVELWEYMQRINEQRKSEVFKQNEIDAWKIAYSNFRSQEFEAANRASKHSASAIDILALLEYATEKFGEQYLEYISPTLKILIKKGLFSKIGVDKIKSLIEKIGDRTTVFLCSSRTVITPIGPFTEQLPVGRPCTMGSDGGEIENYYRTSAFSSFNKLIEANLLDVIGFDNILDIVQISGENVSKAFDILFYLGEKQIKKFGIDQIKQLFKEVSNRAGSSFRGQAYEALLKLAEKGLIEKIGIDRLIEVTSQTFGPKTAEAYEELLKQY